MHNKTASHQRPTGFFLFDLEFKNSRQLKVRNVKTNLKQKYFSIALDLTYKTINVQVKSILF
jgi:hypothetical protein